jgi:hypothetical protein
MARIRTTKKLAQRIDRTYLRKAFAIPLWRRILTAGCVAAALAWLGVYAAERNQTPYTAGALTPAHSFVGKNCVSCHAGGGIGARVADKQCAGCHDAPIHNALQTSTPPCIECHVEHEGVARLAGGSDRSCVECHGNLQTKTGAHTVAAHIDSFRNHPQFAAVTAAKDPTGLIFNHQKHAGELGQKCGDCHPPADVSHGMAKADPRSHVSSRALMAIPTYAATCMTCHPLNFDDKVSDPAPHDKPAVVHQFVVDRLTKLGLQGKIAADEKALWDTTCARCHTMQPAADASGLPVVAPTRLVSRWFGKSTFDHAAHQEVTCVSCHPGGMTSKTSSDILLPGIQVCRQCHTSARNSAGATCATCHVYHDWSKEKGIDGKFMIEQMTD